LFGPAKRRIGSGGGSNFFEGGEKKIERVESKKKRRALFVVRKKGEKKNQAAGMPFELRKSERGVKNAKGTCLGLNEAVESMCLVL